MKSTMLTLTTIVTVFLLGLKVATAQTSDDCKKLFTAIDDKITKTEDIYINSTFIQTLVSVAYDIIPIYEEIKLDEQAKIVKVHTTLNAFDQYLTKVINNSYNYQDAFRDSEKAKKQAIELLKLRFWTADEVKNMRTIKKGKLTDARDGEVYKTVIIGKQEWMAENLRYKAAGSTEIPNHPASKYGRFYTWKVLMNGAKSADISPSKVQGACPKGWNVPSDQDWKSLEISLGMSATDANRTGDRGNVGFHMKSDEEWITKDNSTNNTGELAILNLMTGTNFTKFNVLPLVQKEDDQITFSADYWSSTETDAKHTYFRNLSNDDLGVYRNVKTKDTSLLCRCVKSTPTK